VTYSSSNAEVATVDSSGLVTAVAEGTAVITAKITVDGTDYTASRTITVTRGEIIVVPGEVTNENLSEDLRNMGYTAETARTTLEERMSVTAETRANSSFVDARPMVRMEDGTLRPATAEDFAGGALTVLLPYPEGTNGEQFRFNVAHLVGESAGGMNAGDIETPATSNTPDGIATAFHGLSPVLITWTRVTPGIVVDTPAHVHVYEWDTINATADQDGEMRYQCRICGDIQTRVPITAYYIFNKETTEKIRKAKQGATVKIETSRWISFHKMVMEALAERPDVTLEVSFLDEGHKGMRKSFTIPAGTDVTYLVDDKGFAGFIFLTNKFGH
jgi:hypothetical protein